MGGIPPKGRGGGFATTGEWGWDSSGVSPVTYDHSFVEVGRAMQGTVQDTPVQKKRGAITADVFFRCVPFNCERTAVPSRLELPHEIAELAQRRDDLRLFRRLSLW